ncbi:MAG TPA: hypothetical protein EYG21_03385 [Nitrospinaceae bacterium]|nr:hypothetical protein [Nitrospinaceae bacterium]
MSLNWNLKDIVDFEKVCWQEDQSINPITEGLVFRTMTVSLGEITQKNANEFWERSFMASIGIGQKPISVFTEENGLSRRDYTLEEITKHIGLKTNVSNKSRASFMKDVRRNIEALARKRREYQEAKAL